MTIAVIFFLLFLQTYIICKPYEDTFEKQYCLNFSYTDNEVNVEYVAWNSKAGDYTNVKAKAVYQTNENGMNYMAYSWNEKENSWNLVTEHNATHWSGALLANK